MRYIKERRAESRLPATYTITFECYRRGIKIGEGYARTVDVSEHGALVELPIGLDLDSSVVLSINAPFHTLVLRGDVIHSRPIEGGAYHIGVKLIDSIEGNWEHLKLDIRSQINQIENEE